MKALITGVTGQDGSSLAELLLKKACEVYGAILRAFIFNTGRIEHLFKAPHVEGDRSTPNLARLVVGADLLSPKFGTLGRVS